MKRIKKGMTLLEVVIAMSIFSIVMVAISSTITFSAAAQLRSRSQYDVNVYANSVIDYVKANKTIGINNYRVYFGNGDQLKAKLNALPPTPEVNTGNLRFQADIVVADYTGGADCDDLVSLTVDIVDLRQSGKSCHKEFLVDR